MKKPEVYLIDALREISAIYKCETEGCLCIKRNGDVMCVGASAKQALKDYRESAKLRRKEK